MDIVYLIFEPANNLTKIGLSTVKSFSQRISSIKREQSQYFNEYCIHPLTDLKVLNIIELHGNTKTQRRPIEKFLHRYFREYNYMYEWFLFDKNKLENDHYFMLDNLINTEKIVFEHEFATFFRYKKRFFYMDVNLNTLENIFPDVKRNLNFCLPNFFDNKRKVFVRRTN